MLDVAQRPATREPYLVVVSRIHCVSFQVHEPGSLVRGRSIANGVYLPMSDTSFMER